MKYSDTANTVAGLKKYLQQ